MAFGGDILVNVDKNEVLKTSIRNLKLDEIIQNKLYSLDIKDVETLLSYCKNQKKFNDFIILLQERLYKYYEIPDYLLIRKLKYAVHMLGIRFPYEEKVYRKITKNKKANISDLKIPDLMIKKLLAVAPDNKIKTLLKVPKQELLSIPGFGSGSLDILISQIHSIGLIFDFERLTNEKNNIFDSTVDRLLNEKVIFLNKEMTIIEYLNYSIYESSYEHDEANVKKMHQLGLKFLYEDATLILNQSINKLYIEASITTYIKKKLKAETIRDISKFTKEELDELIGKEYAYLIIKKFGLLGIQISKSSKRKKVVKRQNITLETIGENQELIQEYKDEISLCGNANDAFMADNQKRKEDIKRLQEQIDYLNKELDCLLEGFCDNRRIADKKIKELSNAFPEIK